MNKTGKPIGNRYYKISKRGNIDKLNITGGLGKYKKIIGMTINEAEKSINMTVREIEKDGQSFAYT